MYHLIHKKDLLKGLNFKLMRNKKRLMKVAQSYQIYLKTLFSYVY